MAVRSSIVRGIRGRSRALTIGVTTAAVVGTGVVVFATQGAQSTAASLSAAAVTRNGTSAGTAAASCWAIKQTNPAAADGIYWLQTPKLVAPEQFYCDMTTDGGGWVLIGRGRQAWNFAYPGQQGAANVRNTPTGTAAFNPAALPGDTVNGLLNGANVKDLPDGVRIKRATNVDGTKWQEVRWKFAKSASWSWTFDADPAHALTSVSFDGTSFSGGDTGDTARDSALSPTRRIYTRERKENGWARGFAYGSYVTAGSNSPTSYLWKSGNLGGDAIPFAQVFIRPKITNVTYPEIPQGGTPADTKPPLISNASSATPWGVTETTTGLPGEAHLEVQGFAVNGNTIYVGGEFKNVQKGPNPAAGEKVAQPYLAAFDTQTGEWKSGFRPKLNGSVWDLQMVGGKLVVGGEFTKANDAANTAGLVALDPVTGQNAPGWLGNVTATDGGPAVVRTLDLQGDWLYAGGTFTKVRGGNPITADVTLGRAARFRASDGKPDGTWKPNFSAMVMELDATAERVYFAGHFTSVSGQPARKIAVLGTTSPAAKVPGLNDQNWQPSIDDVQKQYQQIIREYGDKVWVGGSEHVFQPHTKSAFDRIRGVITKPGGDFQAAAEINGVVYGSCHCYKFVYHDADKWPTPSTWSQIQTSNAVIAFDGKTGEPMPNFWPSLATRAGNGPFELTRDNQGCLWVGGDVNRGSWAGSGYQWAGGFAKFCASDATAPGKPSNLKAASVNGGVKLTWTGSTDNSGAVKYEILRDDRVIGVTTSTTLTDLVAGAHSYYVRAADWSGNRSASTGAVTTP
ncbi:fibrinogen-like YCDxxxxGGGW domain-containing protein [Actinomadura sp. 6N118]|uniref:fibrinogen-like YCDxxxxGGGW domain-containing protein n=1 Tax=Actinomadura sp. 6N118 TaxID=3375151 RepID=UPI0037BA9BC6